LPPDNEYSTELAESLGAVYVGTEPSDAGSAFQVYKLDMTAERDTQVEYNDDT
jgi:hypothetical protein